MKTRKSLRICLAIGALALLASACGDDDDGGDDAGGGSGGGETAAAPTYEIEAVSGLSGTPKSLADAGKVTIGVKGDQPNLGFKDSRTNEFSGFDIEIAKMIAADLGIDTDGITFVEIPSKNRETALSNGEVDYYVGTYTINDERKQQVSFAGPYFVAGQDLLIRSDDDSISGPDDLSGKTVCSATGSTPIQNIKDNYPDAKTTEFDVYSKCVDALLNGQADAVTTDDAILVGYAAQYPDELKVVGETFSEEPYGVGVKHGDMEMAEFVAAALDRHNANGDYAAAFDATLGKSGEEAPDMPEVTTG